VNKSSKVLASSSVQIQASQIADLIKGNRVVVDDTEIVLEEAAEEMAPEDIMSIITEGVQSPEEDDEEPEEESYVEDEEEEED
jgi:uncharacterized protein YaiL (DUF2058 family)